MKTYYIIMHEGIPCDVAATRAEAVAKVAQWTTQKVPYEFVAVTPVQTEFEFADEEPTKPTVIYNTGCVLGEGCLNNNYEVGSGARCGGCGK